MNEEIVRKIIREELAVMMKNDQMVFSLPIQILDGKNIQTGRTTGTKIGTASDQKIGFFGKSPVAQQVDFGSETVTGSAADPSARTAINNIRTILLNLGFIA